MKYLNEIVQGNCLELIKGLPDESIDSVVSDPPYGEGMNYDGDSNIREAKDLLDSYLSLLYPKLKRNAHILIFFTMRQVDVVIDLLKKHYTFRRVLTMYLPKGGARPYLGWLPRTQAIVLAQKYLPCQPTEFHSIMAKYVKAKMIETGHTCSSLAKILGVNGRLIMKYSRVNDPAWCLPTPKTYARLKELLSLDDRLDALLTRENPQRHNRTDFTYHHDCYVVDNLNEKMLHPSQKPLSVVESLVSIATPANGVVLDGFMGCGTTAVAARNTGRNFIGFEISPEFCEIARQRLMFSHF